MGHGGRGSNALLSCRRKAWLGRQDSNLGSRDQNPLPYRLATPHAGRLLPRAAAARKRAGRRPFEHTRPIDPVCLSLRAGIFSAARMRARRAQKAAHRKNTGAARAAPTDGRARTIAARIAAVPVHWHSRRPPSAIQALRCGVPSARHGTWPIQPARPGADSCSLSGRQEREPSIRPVTLSAVRRSAFRPPCRPSADWISGGSW